MIDRDYMVEVVEDFDDFQDRCFALARHAAALLAVAGEPATAENIRRVARSAPRSDEWMRSRHWPETYCERLLAAADARAGARAACRLRAYFTVEYPRLPWEAQGRILAAVDGLVDGLYPEPPSPPPAPTPPPRVAAGGRWRRAGARALDGALRLGLAGCLWAAAWCGGVLIVLNAGLWHPTAAIPWADIGLLAGAAATGVLAWEVAGRA